MTQPTLGQSVYHDHIQVLHSLGSRWIQVGTIVWLHFFSTQEHRQLDAFMFSTPGGPPLNNQKNKCTQPGWLNSPVMMVSVAEFMMPSEKKDLLSTIPILQISLANVYWSARSRSFILKRVLILFRTVLLNIRTSIFLTGLKPLQHS